MTFEDDPHGTTIEKIAKGATEATLEYTEGKIRNAILGFSKKKYYFNNDELYNCAKRHRNKAEVKIFKTFIKEKKFHTLFQVGLTLREYDKTGEKSNRIKKIILNNYDQSGLNFLSFVQKGLFTIYLCELLLEGVTTDRMMEKINYSINNSDCIFSYINIEDNIKKSHIIRKILNKIDTNPSDKFMFTGPGGEDDLCEEIKECIVEQLPSSYTVKLIEDETDKRKIYLIKRSYEDMFSDPINEQDPISKMSFDENLN